MDSKTVLPFINKLSFFHDFSPEEKQAIAESEGTVLKYNPSESIIKESAMDDAFFIIIQGVVDVSKGTKKDVIISQLKPGSVFGEISLISHRPRTTNITARTEVFVMRFTKEVIAGLDLIIQKKASGPVDPGFNQPAGRDESKAGRYIAKSVGFVMKQFAPVRPSLLKA